MSGAEVLLDKGLEKKDNDQRTTERKDLDRCFS